MIMKTSQINKIKNFTKCMFVLIWYNNVNILIKQNVINHLIGSKYDKRR